MGFLLVAVNALPVGMFREEVLGSGEISTQANKESSASHSRPHRIYLFLIFFHVIQPAGNRMAARKVRAWILRVRLLDAMRPPSTARFGSVDPGCRSPLAAHQEQRRPMPSKQLLGV
jgi:hypothetical protein